MKQLIIIILFFCSTTVAVHAKQVDADAVLLSTYYDMKNALVNSDAHSAAEKARLFVQTADSMEPGNLSAGQAKGFKEIRTKLLVDAKKIAATNDLAKQRIYFAALSLNMYSLAKITSLSSKPIYKAYCPMKRAYWLSNATAITNPYYGKVMLTCGSVADTIKP
ncbi:MAG: hypothetical protein JWQ25_2343 [Daejeonella sp.]|nr:hypothetical protein [Daejeonella sp.]